MDTIVLVFVCVTLSTFITLKKTRKCASGKKVIYIACNIYLGGFFVTRTRDTFFPWSCEFYGFRGEFRHFWRNNITSAAQDLFIHHSIFVHAWLLGWLLNIGLMITFFRKKVNMFIPNNPVMVAFMTWPMHFIWVYYIYNCWPDTSCTL